MPITRTKYDIAHTSWADLANNAWAGSAIHDFRSSGAHDAIIAGQIAVDETNAPTAGDTVDIYLFPFMRNAGNTRDFLQGGMTDEDTRTPYDQDETLTEGGSGNIKLENMVLAASLTLEAVADVGYDFVFGVVATLGYMPDQVGVVIYNGVTTYTLGPAAGQLLEVTELAYS